MCIRIKLIRKIFLLFFLIPTLGFAIDWNSPEGTTTISENEFKKLSDNAEFILFDQGKYEETFFIIFEEKNNMNIKFSWEYSSGYYNKIYNKTLSQVNDYCFKLAKSTVKFDNRIVKWSGENSRYYKFVDYPKKNQVRFRCLTKKEFYQNREKIL